MLSLVVDRCAEILAATPDPVLPLASLGSRRPSTGADVPAVAMSVAVDTPQGIGFGRLVRPDDVLGDRYRGLLVLELWAQSASDVDSLSRKVQSRLAGPTSLTREKGFMLVRPADLDPAENVLYQPATGSAFPVWKQRLAYRFVFEYETGAEPTGGGPIKRIDVDVTRPRESFAVP
jgi:hypothetical protein